MSPVDLKILKTLSAALAEALETADLAKDDNTKYVVELSKAAGVALGIVNEATMLTGDIQMLAKKASVPPTIGVQSIFDKLRKGN